MSLENKARQPRENFDWDTLNAESYNLRDVPLSLRESKLFLPQFLPNSISNYWKTYVGILGHDDESYSVANQKLEDAVGQSLSSIFETVAELLQHEEYDKACEALNEVGQKLIEAYRSNDMLDEEDLETTGMLGYFIVNGAKHELTKFSS